jgi:hypothetical protein
MNWSAKLLLARDSPSAAERDKPILSKKKPGAL